ncbi:MAG: response regulator transcription factor [Pirellulales bacterium]|nr:response regulator transcription factor [Pirellulales bacterium]
MTDEQPIVFIVEDDEAVRDSLVAMVSAAGVTVESFASAEEFLAAFDRDQLGCLVSDVRMEGLTGTQLQKRLLDEGVSLPVILISGYADVPTAVDAMKIGAISFLEKPCTRQELWATISKAIATHREQRKQDAAVAEIREWFTQLTQSEREVMARLVAGQANKVIAAELEMGLRTVELRRATILKKMNADSLAELVRQSILLDQFKQEHQGISSLPPDAGAGR